MIDTAGTITQGAKALIEAGGAQSVYACCTHPVLSGPALERLAASPIEKLYVLDTIENSAVKALDKIVEISVASIFAQAIESIFADLPLSRLYE
jgi:ribose-phosphate pyrophosphokinase